jgi:hypothetical protein
VTQSEAQDTRLTREQLDSLKHLAAIRYHHNPLAAGEMKLLTSIVHIADLIALELGLGLGADGLQYPMVAEAFEIVGIAPEQYAETLEKVASIGDEAAGLVN